MPILAHNISDFPEPGESRLSLLDELKKASRRCTRDRDFFWLGFALSGLQLKQSAGWKLLVRGSNEGSREVPEVWEVD